MSQRFYEVLGVPADASDQEVKSAYRQAVLRLHPDKSAAHHSPMDAVKYQELQAAWQVTVSASMFHTSGCEACCHCCWPAAAAIELKKAAKALQVLKDPAARAAYNQQLALEAAQQQVFISQAITLADMECQHSTGDESLDQSHTVYHHYQCRCGGTYWLDPALLGAPDDIAVLQCDTCSLHIEVRII